MIRQISLEGGNVRIIRYFPATNRRTEGIYRLTLRRAGLLNIATYRVKAEPVICYPDDGEPWLAITHCRLEVST